MKWKEKIWEREKAKVDNTLRDEHNYEFRIY